MGWRKYWLPVFKPIFLVLPISRLCLFKSFSVTAFQWCMAFERTALDYFSMGRMHYVEKETSAL